MPGNATFGDFWIRAASQLHPADGSPPAQPGPREIRAAAAAMHRVVTVITRYLDDGRWMFSYHAAGPWNTAFTEARIAAHRAESILGSGLPASDGNGALAGRLHEAAGSLTLARDLLHTHFVRDPAGGRVPQSDWADVIASTPVSRALLAALAGQAGAVAAQASALPLPQNAGERMAARWQRVAHACRWLQALEAAVLAAHLQEPVPDSDMRLLAAIPVNAAPARRLPHPADPVTTLSAGTVTAAERVSRAARDLAAQAWWAPDMNATSARRSAAACVVTALNCETILGSLAAADGAGYLDLPAELADTAAAASAARAAWLMTARSWDQMTTDCHGYPSQAAADAEDLALWTGRLAYADPSWTPAREPSRSVRPASGLADSQLTLTGTAAAVHYAASALHRLAAAGHAQVTAAATAGRLYVPTRSLPDGYDVPHRLAAAPLSRVDAMLGRYAAACQASGRFLETAGRVAETVGSPSRILTAAGGAVGWPAGRAISSGLVLQVLQRMGVTSPDLLQRAAAVDTAAGLLLEEAHRSPRRRAVNSSRAAAPAPGASGRPASTAATAGRNPEGVPELVA
jgi:hypothetical protein